MKIAVFSDLHLGPGALNRCSVPRRKIERWLNLIDSTHERVIVAGDLYDLSRPRTPLGWRDHLDTIRFEWGPLMERLESYEAVYGNHDRQRQQLGVPERIEIQAEAGKIVVMHGHQFDPHIKQIPGLELAANFAAGWMSRLGVASLAKLMGGVVALDERLESAMRDKRGQAHADLSMHGAVSTARQGVDLVIMGHSHELRSVELGAGSQFANTGSWVSGTADWVSIDTDTLKIHLFRDGACLNAARSVDTMTAKRLRF